MVWGLVECSLILMFWQYLLINHRIIFFLVYQSPLENTGQRSYLLSALSMSSSEYWPEYFIYFTTETLDLKFMETSGDRNSVSTFPQRLKVFLNFHPLGMEGSCLLYLASSLEEHFLILFGYFWQYLTISPTSLPAVWPSEVLGFKQCWGGVMEMLSTLSFIFRSVATWQTHSELTGSCPPPTLGSCSHVAR